MNPAYSSSFERIAKSKAILYALVVANVSVAIFSYFDFVFKISTGGEAVLTDFHSFYVVGKMFMSGVVENAYHYKTMFEAQEAVTGAQSFMPWTYPPFFNFIAALLSILPLGLSYILFISLTGTAYLLILRKISGEYFCAVLMAIEPALLINIRCGQNGFVTGALIGLFVFYALRARSVAGVPLGLMVIKPHLAVGVSIFTVLSRRWGVFAVAAAAVVVSSLAVTVCMGREIWLAFLGGIGEARQFLELGLYPMNRMSSVYAALQSLGIPVHWAFSVQVAAAFGACLVVGVACWNRWSVRRILGLAVIASLCVSPYSYDYDLTILGVAVAVLIGDISRHTSDKEKLLLLALSWVGCGWGVATSLNPGHWGSEILPEDRPVTLAGVAVLLLFVCILNVVRRAERYDAGSAQSASASA